MTSLIRTERHRDIHIIALNRPDKRNALTPPMLDDLRAAITAAPAESRALLLTGEGPVFCGGFDLKLCLDHPPTLPALLTGLFDTIAALRALPIPVIIAAHGAAIAGGCALLGGADIVITDRAAKLGYPVLPLGISPAVSAPYLRLAIGDGPARSRLLEPTLIDGAEAHRLGLAHELVETPGHVRPRALEVAHHLASKPPGALAATRAWLNEIDEALAHTNPRRGLETSLAITGSEEEHQRLTALFN